MNYFLVIKRTIWDWYSGCPDQRTLTILTVMIGIALAAVVSYYITKLLLGVVEKIVEKSSNKWDDDLINKRLVIGVSQLAPALVVNWLVPGFLTTAEQKPFHWLTVITSIYILVVIVRIINIFIGNLYTGMSHRKKTRPYAIKGLFQMVKLIMIGIGIIYGISILIGKQPGVILTALGASAAVLMLVFQDTILGLVASIQLTANNMLHKGDWVICDQHGANGEVEDVSLTTVKVRNWDNSITTIPPYKLISDSFKNYQPMRRIKSRLVSRSIYIDVNSVRYLDAEEINEITARVSGYESEEIKSTAERGDVNLRVFRKYLEGYLRRHPDVNDTELIMVRQMDPTQGGLPLQLFFYTPTVEWKPFEDVQSDIFDHVYATIGEFGLKVFQYPSGEDLRDNGILGK